MSILWKRVHHSKKDIGIAIDFLSIAAKNIIHFLWEIEEYSLKLILFHIVIEFMTTI